MVPLARELQQKELGVGASFTAGLIPDFMKPAVNPSEQSLLLPEMLELILCDQRDHGMRGDPNVEGREPLRID